MKRKDLPLFHNADAKRVIAEACQAHGVTLALLRRLLDVQRNYAGSGRQTGITLEFDASFAEFVEDDHEER